MDEDTINVKLQTEDDFIAIKRFGFSLRSIMDRYPEGVPDRYIAQALAVPEEELPVLYDSVVAKLRTLMQIEA
jgi:hypothetical protein